MSKSRPRNEYEPDPTELVELLLERTVAGKIDWKPSAALDKFLATVGGQSYQLKLTWTDDYSAGQAESIQVAELALLSPKGKAMWQISAGDVERPVALHYLYRAARRAALRLDDVVETAVHALKEL